MGMSDWLKKKQQEIEDALNAAKDPEAQKKQQREDAKKNAARLVKIAQTAKKASDTYKGVAEKVDNAAQSAKSKAADLLGKAAQGIEKLEEKFNKPAEEKPAVDKPSTGGTLVDLIVPAVPEKKKPDTPNGDAPKNNG